MTFVECPLHVLENTKVNNNSKKDTHLQELIVLSQGERRDEGGRNRYAEFCWTKIEVERRKGILWGRINKIPSLERGNCGA